LFLGTRHYFTLFMVHSPRSHLHIRTLVRRNNILRLYGTSFAEGPAYGESAMLHFSAKNYHQTY
jgi:hypothetical protein